MKYVCDLFITLKYYEFKNYISGANDYQCLDYKCLACFLLYLLYQISEKNPAKSILYVQSMSDTAEDIQDGFTARATRGSGVSGGVVPRIESIDEYKSSHDNLEQPSELNSRLVEILNSDLLACDVQVYFLQACI